MLPPLSPRLSAVARQVRSGAPMADIGTDHAYLPAALVAAGICPRAIAADVRPGPLAQAKATLEAAEGPLAIELRLGNGLQVLKPGEAGTITLCGMGGPLISELLAAAPAGVLAPGVRVVAQPMQGEHVLRHWLHEQGWTFCHEELVEDEGRIYPVIVAEVAVHTAPGEPWGSGAEWVGPLLRQGRDPLLPAYLDSQIGQMRRALAQLTAARGEAGQQRLAELQQRLSALEAERQAATQRLRQALHKEV